LPIIFRDVSNYRTETLTFEVVNFFGPYHIILGHPCDIKCMAIPCYAYLMLKIPGPSGIITMEAMAQWALDFEYNSIELATATVTTTELKELCFNAPPSSFDPAMPSMTSTFNVAEDAKVVQIDVADLTKIVQIEVVLSPKIGRRARWLPPMQQRCVCVETSRNVGCLLGGC
jgi:hypothetical protein